MRLVNVPFFLIGVQLTTAALPLLPGQIKNLVVFGDSYSVQNAGVGRIQWVDWLASKDYANLKLYDFAKSGATCSQALTPRIYPGIVEDELPEFFGKQRNGTVPRLSASTTLYAIWIGTNDLGPGCLLTGEQTRGVSVVDTVNCVGNVVKQLYKNGGRNFVVLNTVALDRAPMYQTTAYPTKYYFANTNATAWNVHMQTLTKAGNSLSQYVLRDLADELPLAKIGVFNSYGLLNDITDRPQLYLNGTIPFNVTGSVNPCRYQTDGTSLGCTVEAKNESEWDSFVWYNELHLTNQANRVFAKELTAVVKGRQNRWMTWF